jgi:hypothetical protein
LSTSQNTPSHSPTPTTESTAPETDDPIQLPGSQTGTETPAPYDARAVAAPHSLAVTTGTAELATTNYDDGFSESVPFQALALRINRSKGAFLLEGDAEDRAEVYLIPRGSASQKSYYGLPYDPKTPHEASCASPDGKVGYGWIDPEQQTELKARACASCPRRGFGAGTCDDLQTLLAYDVEKQTPVLVTFKNAEINPRRGVFTLAVNRMRTMGLKPTDCIFKLSFGKADGPYYNVQIDVKPVADAGLPDGKAHEIAELLDNCWQPYREAQIADAGALSEQL